MNMTVAPSFLDIEAAYRREQIQRDWGRATWLPRHRPDASRPHRGAHRAVIGAGRRTAAVAR